MCLKLRQVSKCGWMKLKYWEQAFFPSRRLPGDVAFVHFIFIAYCLQFDDVGWKCYYTLHLPSLSITQGNKSFDTRHLINVSTVETNRMESEIRWINGSGHSNLDLKEGPLCNIDKSSNYISRVLGSFPPTTTNCYRLMMLSLHFCWFPLQHIILLLKQLEYFLTQLKHLTCFV